MDSSTEGETPFPPASGANVDQQATATTSEAEPVDPEEVMVTSKAEEVYETPVLREKDMRAFLEGSSQWHSEHSEFVDRMKKTYDVLFSAPPAFPPPMDFSVKVSARGLQLSKRPTDENFDEVLALMIATFHNAFTLHSSFGTYRRLLTSMCVALEDVVRATNDFYSADLVGMPMRRWGTELSGTLVAALKEGISFNSCMSFFWQRVSKDFQDYVSILDYAAPMLEELGTLATVFDHKRAQCIQLFNKGHVPAARRRQALENLARALQRYQELQFILYHQIMMFILMRSSPLVSPILEFSTLQESLYSNLENVFAYAVDVLDLSPTGADDVHQRIREAKELIAVHERSLSTHSKTGSTDASESGSSSHTTSPVLRPSGGPSLPTLPEQDEAQSHEGSTASSTGDEHSTVSDQNARVQRFKDMMSATYDSSSLGAAGRPRVWRRQAVVEEESGEARVEEPPKQSVPTFLPLEKFVQSGRKPYHVLCLLLNPVAAMHVRRFARSIDFESPILFFLKVERFLRIDPTSMERMNAALQIYNVFLSAGFDSPHQLTFVGPEQLNNVERILSECHLGGSTLPADSCFDKIQSMAFALISKDIIPSFLKSPRCAEMFEHLMKCGFIEERPSKESVTCSVLDYEELRTRMYRPLSSSAEGQEYKKRRAMMSVFRDDHGIPCLRDDELGPGSRFEHSSRQLLQTSDAYMEVSTLIKSQADLFATGDLGAEAIDEAAELEAEQEIPPFTFNGDEYELPGTGMVASVALAKLGLWNPSLRRHPHARSSFWRPSSELCPEMRLQEFFQRFNKKEKTEEEESKAPKHCPRCCRRIALIEANDKEYYSCVCSFVLAGNINVHTDPSKGLFAVAINNLATARAKGKDDASKRHKQLSRPWRMTLRGPLVMADSLVYELFDGPCPGPVISCPHYSPLPKILTDDCQTCRLPYTVVHPILTRTAELAAVEGMLSESNSNTVKVAVLDRDIFELPNRSKVLKRFFPPDYWTMEGMIHALRRRGFTHVFEATNGRKLQILEAAQDLVVRITMEDQEGSTKEARGRAGVVPMITSTSPAFYALFEKHCPSILSHLCTVKSAFQIIGSLSNTFVAQMAGVEAGDVSVVVISDSRSAKRDRLRIQYTSHGVPSVNAVLAIEELASLLLSTKGVSVEFPDEPWEFNAPFRTPARRQPLLAPRKLEKSCRKIVEKFEEQGTIIRAVVAVAHRLLTSDPDLWKDWEEEEEELFEPHPSLKEVWVATVDGEERSLHVAIVAPTTTANLVAAIEGLSYDSRYHYVDFVVPDSMVVPLVDSSTPPRGATLPTQKGKRVESVWTHEGRNTRPVWENPLKNLKGVRKRIAGDLGVIHSIEDPKETTIRDFYAEFLNAKIQSGGCVKELIMHGVFAPVKKMLKYEEQEFELLVDSSTGLLEAQQEGGIDFGRPPSDDDDSD